MPDESRDEYPLLFDQAPSAALVLDSGLSIRRANLALRELLGNPQLRLEGGSLRRFLSEGCRQGVLEHLANAKANAPVPQAVETELVRVDGSIVPVRLHTRYLQSHGGLYSTSIADLGERESERARYRELLDAELKARSEALGKDRFIATLSHELRAPLTPALAATSALVAHADLPEEPRKLLQVIRRSLTAEAQLIDDLLDVSRIVNGKVGLIRKPLDLHELIFDCIDGMTPIWAGKGLRVVTDLEAERRHVAGDPLKLRQVITNVLRNSIKFSEAGGEIRVASWNNDLQIAVEIEDTGIGIAAEMLPQLFEPFAQGDNRQANAAGLGLGLTIAKGLLDLHEGRISAASQGSGRGARFVIELATIPAPAAAAFPAEMPGSRRASADSSPRPHKRRILLVEDDADTADVVTWALNGSGYEVEAASSLKLALEVDIEHVDVIVSDLGLPDGSGLDLLRNLRMHGHKKPAIALSGFGMTFDKKATKDAGFDLHLTKPIEIEQLLEAIASL